MTNGKTYESMTSKYTSWKIQQNTIDIENKPIVLAMVRYF